jgi:adenine-specific DNA-methyltransferase
LLPKGSFSIEKDLEQIQAEYLERDDFDNFRLLELRNTHREFGKHNRKNLFYPLYANTQDGQVSLESDERKTLLKILPIWDDGFEGCWTWEKDKVRRDIDLLLAKKNENGSWKIYRKDYASGAHKMLKTHLAEKSFYTERGQSEFNSLFETKAKLFPSPKSVALLKALLSTRLEDGDIVLDFFAGSGTTAQAVLELNEEDGGNRQFILVQMPEQLDAESEAYKAGYRTIADICQARIRKVIEKLAANDANQRESNNQTKLFAEIGEIRGFQTFRIAPSNFKQWRDVEGKDAILEQLDIFRHSEKETSESAKMLYEILLKAGFPLTAKIETAQVDGQTVYVVEDGKLLACFDGFNAAIQESIHARKPQRVICLDRVFNGDDQVITNLKLELQEAGIELTII